jgi:hypothetical protein
MWEGITARRNITQLKMKSSLAPVRSITAKGGKNMLQKVMTRRLNRGILILRQSNQSIRLLRCVSKWYMIPRLIIERKEHWGVDSGEHEYV